MEFLKLLPILFVVSQGEGRALMPGRQLLPEIPGYVPVYIQEGPDVEVIYESGRKVPGTQAVIRGSSRLEDEPAAVVASQGQAGLQGEEKEAPAPASVSQLSPQPEQHNSISENEPLKTEKTPSKEGEVGVGTVQEVGSFQVKER